MKPSTTNPIPHENTIVFEPPGSSIADAGAAMREALHRLFEYPCPGPNDERWGKAVEATRLWDEAGGPRITYVGHPGFRREDQK